MQLCKVLKAIAVFQHSLKALYAYAVGVHLGFLPPQRRVQLCSELDSNGPKPTGVGFQPLRPVRYPEPDCMSRLRIHRPHAGGLHDLSSISLDVTFPVLW